MKSDDNNELLYFYLIYSLKITLAFLKAKNIDAHDFLRWEAN